MYPSAREISLELCASMGNAKAASTSANYRCQPGPIRNERPALARCRCWLGTMAPRLQYSTWKIYIHFGVSFNEADAAAHPVSSPVKQTFIN